MDNTLAVVGLVLSVGWICYRIGARQFMRIPRGQDMLSREKATPEPAGRTGPVVVQDVND